MSDWREIVYAFNDNETWAEALSALSEALEGKKQWSPPFYLFWLMQREGKEIQAPVNT